MAFLLLKIFLKSIKLKKKLCDQKPQLKIKGIRIFTRVSKNLPVVEIEKLLYVQINKCFPIAEIYKGQSETASYLKGQEVGIDNWVETKVCEGPNQAQFDLFYW